VELNPASYGQLTAILRESFGVFGGGFSPEDFLRMNLRLARHPWSKERFRHLALVDKVNFLRSSVKVYEISGRLKGRTLRVALLSELFTLPRERRRGFASALIEMLIRQLRQEGFDLALIFSDLPTRFFARFGFVELESSDLFFDLVIPVEPAKKVAEARHKIPEVVRSLYHDSCAADFFIERDAPYWDMLRLKKTLFNRLQWDLGRESLHLREDGAAYLWTRWTGKRLEILDAAWRDPAALVDVFAALLAKHGSGVLSQAGGRLPPAFERLPFVKAQRRLPRKMGILMASDLTGRKTGTVLTRVHDLQFWELDRL